jgi:hypothetical protein
MSVMCFKEGCKQGELSKPSAYLAAAFSLFCTLSLTTGCGSSTKRAVSTGVAAEVTFRAEPTQKLAESRPLILYPKRDQYSTYQEKHLSRSSLARDELGARARYSVAAGSRDIDFAENPEVDTRKVARQQLILQRRGPYPPGTKPKNSDPYLEMLITRAKFPRDNNSYNYSYYSNNESDTRREGQRRDAAEVRTKEGTRLYRYNPANLSTSTAVAEAPRNNYSYRPTEGSKGNDIKPRKWATDQALTTEAKGLAKFEVAAKKNTVSGKDLTPVVKPVLPDSDAKDIGVKSKTQQMLKDHPKELTKQDTSPQLKATKSEAPKSELPSAECKKASKERDLAAQTEEHSSKLFHIRRALRLCPNSAPLHHDLGQLYLSMDRAKDAEDEFKQALIIDPNFSASKRSLSTILKGEAKF